MTDDDSNYVCTLSKASLEKAKKELNENAKDRISSVQAFRSWILDQPHIKWPTDTRMLLRILRMSKFSQLKARTMLDNLTSMATEYPEWFKDMDTHCPRVWALLDSLYIIPLGKTSSGTMVMLQRMGVLNPSCGKYSKYDVMKANGFIYNYLLQDEEVEVNGVLYIIDATGVGIKQQQVWTVNDLKGIARMWQKALPVRFKGFHFYNTGPVTESVIRILRANLSKKFGERMHLHSTLETIYKHVPMELLPEEYLPDEYDGPCRGSMQSIVAEWKVKLQDPKYREYLLELSDRKWRVDESKRPGSQPEASFRKLNID